MPTSERSLMYAGVGWYEVLKSKKKNGLTGCTQVSWPVKQAVMDFVPVGLVRGQVMVTHICTKQCVVKRRCAQHITVPNNPEQDTSGRSPRPDANVDCTLCANAQPQVFHCHPSRTTRGGAENNKKWLADLFNVFTEADGFTAGRRRV